MIKIYIFLSGLLVLSCGGQVKSKVKHPQELDMSYLVGNDETDLLDWTEEKKNSKINCDAYFRRLVKNLFEKSRYHRDPHSADYIASVSLRLTKDQWELLVNHNIDGLNLNEIDDLLDDVLRRSKEERGPQVSEILFEHYRNQIVDSLPRLDSPVMLVLIAVVVVFVLNRACSFSKLTYSAVILLVLFGICILSYLMTYWDCQNDLEVEQMIQLSKRNSPNNPCKDYDGEQEGFMSSVKAYVFGSSENKCLEHMRKTFKPSKNFCDPLDVFAKWFAKIQMSYFNSVIGSFLEAVSRLTSSSNLVTKIILWVVAAAAFGYFIVSMGKVVVKHSFKGFFTVLTTTKLKPPSTETSSSTDYSALSSKMDEILFENKQMKRELSIIRECSVERSIGPEKPTPLGIENRQRLTDINEESFDSLKDHSPKRSTSKR